MPLWKLDIEKLLQGEYWSNRYIIEEASLATALLAAEPIVDAERSIHQTVVNFTKYRVSDMVLGTDIYQTVTINLPGLSTQSDQWLPLFNVVRVDFNTVGGGRPSRKYLRLPISEVWTQNGNLVNTFVSEIQINYADALIDLPQYVDVDGQAFSNASVSPYVGMRQLRRGSKRKLAPIIP